MSPQSSDAARASWDLETARDFLLKRQWTVDAKNFWHRPHVDHEPSDEEQSALDYLFFEWDYAEAPT